jgi:hypothetical protein
MSVNIPYLVAELNRAVQVRGPEVFSSSLMDKVAQLFLAHSNQGQASLGAFDQVFSKLVHRIEKKARAEIAARLSGLTAAPLLTSRCMALDDEIEVAKPILEKVAGLGRETLITVANAKSQAHLLSITGRNDLDEAVTDVLIQRGDRQVVFSLVENRAARVSSSGFARLIARSESDDPLATSVGRRADLPPDQCLSLLTTASLTVRTTLEKEYPALSQMVLKAVTECAGRVLREAHRETIDYSKPTQEMQRLYAAGELGEQNIRNLTANGYLVELIAALGVLSNSTAQVAEAAFIHARPDGILIIAKVLGLSWITVRGILLIRAQPGRISEAELGCCERIYSKLERWAAREALVKATVNRHARAA